MVGEAGVGEVAPGPESDRTGFVLLAGPGQARWMRVLPAAVRHRNPGPGPCSAISLLSLPPRLLLLVLSGGPCSSPLRIL